MSELIEAQRQEAVEALLTQLKIRENVNIELIILQQMQRTLISIAQPDQINFENNVRGLLYLLPADSYIRVLNKSNEYNDVIQKWEYKKWCNVNMGSIDRPITRDGKPPKEDWSNVVSPIPYREEKTDYEKLLQVIISEIERIGLSWKKERITRVRPRLKPKELGPRTPINPEPAIPSEP